ncbi:MAG: type IVB secretion system lipoprotein DotD [Gammaproteobacteria bacterium]
MKKQHLAVICVLFSLVSGCATPKRVPNDTIAYAPFDLGAQNARISLSESAASVSNSLNRLSAIEKAIHPEAKIPPAPNPYAIGLGIPASVDWTGPIEPLVAKLAAAGNYKYRVIGNRPSIPVIVQIYDNNMPIADILRDIDYQADKKADVQIYPSRRTIELRYRNF